MTSKFDKNRIYKWILFALIFCISIVYSFVRNVTEYPYDSCYYWITADPVFANGFNILSFPETFRGYFFPTIVSFFKIVFRGVWGWRILNSIILSVGFSISLPYVFKKRAINSLKELIRVLLAFLFFLWIWGDFTQYPLTDLIAAVCIISSVAIFQKLSKDENLKWGYIIPLSILAGGLIYIAYNSRVVYAYAGVAIIIVFAVKNLKNLKTVLISCVSIIIGAGIISLPQCLINNQYVGEFNPKVYTEQHYNYQHDLKMQQVYWGLTYDRYDTYVGDESLFPTPGVFYLDPTGAEILMRENISIEEFDTKQFFVLFFKYPLDMTGIYARHAVSIMTPSTDEIYIKNIYNDKILIVVLSILLWIVAAISILKTCKWNGDTAWIVMMVIPSLLQLLGATELRFFIVVYLLTYIYVFYVINYKTLWNSIRDNLLKNIVVAAIVFVLWISVFGSILANNNQKTFLIDDSVIPTIVE